MTADKSSFKTKFAAMRKQVMSKLGEKMKNEKMTDKDKKHQKGREKGDYAASKRAQEVASPKASLGEKAKMKGRMGSR